MEADPKPQFMRRAVELSAERMREGAGGPFGAVIVKDGKVDRRRLEPRHLEQRSDRACRSHRYPRRLQSARHVLARRLRDLHELRALSDVPLGDLLGAAGPDLFSPIPARTRRRSASTTSFSMTKFRSRSRSAPFRPSSSRCRKPQRCSRSGKRSPTRSILNASEGGRGA